MQYKYHNIIFDLDGTLINSGPGIIHAVQYALKKYGINETNMTVLNGFEDGLAIRPIKEHPERNVALAWQNWDTMSLASRKFVEFIKENFVFAQEK